MVNGCVITLEGRERVEHRERCFAHVSPFYPELVQEAQAGRDVRRDGGRAGGGRGHHHRETAAMNREDTRLRLAPPLLALLLLLAACGGDGATEPATNPTMPAAATPRPAVGAVARLGKAVETGHIIVTPARARRPGAGRRLRPPTPRRAGCRRPRDRDHARVRRRQPYSAENAILETTAGPAPRPRTRPHAGAALGIITSTGPVRGWSHLRGAGRGDRPPPALRHARPGPGDVRPPSLAAPPARCPRAPRPATRTWYDAGGPVTGLCHAPGMAPARGWTPDAGEVQPWR